MGELAVQRLACPLQGRRFLVHLLPQLVVGPLVRLGQDRLDAVARGRLLPLVRLPELRGLVVLAPHLGRETVLHAGARRLGRAGGRDEDAQARPPGLAVVEGRDARQVLVHHPLRRIFRQAQVRGRHRLAVEAGVGREARLRQAVPPLVDDVGCDGAGPAAHLARHELQIGGAAQLLADLHGDVRVFHELRGGARSGRRAVRSAVLRRQVHLRRGGDRAVAEGIVVRVHLREGAEHRVAGEEGHGRGAQRPPREARGIDVERLQGQQLVQHHLLRTLAVPLAGGDLLLAPLRVVLRIQEVLHGVGHQHRAFVFLEADGDGQFLPLRVLELADDDVEHGIALPLRQLLLQAGEGGLVPGVGGQHRHHGGHGRAPHIAVGVVPGGGEGLARGLGMDVHERHPAVDQAHQRAALGVVEGRLPRGERRQLGVLAPLQVGPEHRQPGGRVVRVGKPLHQVVGRLHDHRDAVFRPVDGGLLEALQPTGDLADAPTRGQALDHRRAAGAAVMELLQVRVQLAEAVHGPVGDHVLQRLHGGVAAGQFVQRLLGQQADPGRGIGLRHAQRPLGGERGVLAQRLAQVPVAVGQQEGDREHGHGRAGALLELAREAREQVPLALVHALPVGFHVLRRGVRRDLAVLPLHGIRLPAGGQLLCEILETLGEARAGLGGRLDGDPLLLPVCLLRFPRQPGLQALHLLERRARRLLGARLRGHLGPWQAGQLPAEHVAARRADEVGHRRPGVAAAGALGHGEEVADARPVLVQGDVLQRVRGVPLRDGLALDQARRRAVRLQNALRPEILHHLGEDVGRAQVADVLDVLQREQPGLGQLPRGVRLALTSGAADELVRHGRRPAPRRGVGMGLPRERAGRVDADPLLREIAAPGLVDGVGHGRVVLPGGRDVLELARLQAVLRPLDDAQRVAQGIVVAELLLRHVRVDDRVQLAFEERLGVRRDARGEAVLHVGVHRRGQVLPVEVLPHGLEGLQVGAAVGDQLPPHVPGEARIAAGVLDRGGARPAAGDACGQVAVLHPGQRVGVVDERGERRRLLRPPSGALEHGRHRVRGDARAEGVGPAAHHPLLPGLVLGALEGRGEPRHRGHAGAHAHLHRGLRDRLADLGRQAGRDRLLQRLQAAPARGRVEGGAPGLHRRAGRARERGRRGQAHRQLGGQADRHRRLPPALQRLRRLDDVLEGAGLIGMQPGRAARVAALERLANARGHAEGVLGDVAKHLPGHADHVGRQGPRVLLGVARLLLQARGRVPGVALAALALLVRLVRAPPRDGVAEAAHAAPDRGVVIVLGPVRAYAHAGRRPAVRHQFLCSRSFRRSPDGRIARRTCSYRTATWGRCSK